MTSRFCANPPCTRLFKPSRPHQRFCSTTCRRESWAAKQEKSSEADGERVLQGTRRRSRDGNGRHYYLLPNEVEALQASRLAPGVDVAAWQSAQRKLSKSKTAPK